MDVIVLLRELLLWLILYYGLRRLTVRLLPRKNPNPNAPPLPPGPRGFPVVGALPLLGRAPHVALARMAQRHGPVMHLKLGQHGVVVASSPDAARAFLKTLDAHFANRPIDAAPTRIAYGAQDLVFAEYGPRWKLLRRLCNLGMLGPKALEGWAGVRRAEVGHMLLAMCDVAHRGRPVEVAEMLSYAMANMIGQVMHVNYTAGGRSLIDLN